MTLFILLNWIFCLTTSMMLVGIWYRQRFLFVKPSIIVIIFFHLQIQWAATINSGYIEYYLPSPWIFFLLAQTFPLVGLYFSLWIGRRLAYIIWQRLLHPSSISTSKRRTSALFLASFIGFFVGIYFLYVPFSSTGLYKIFTDPMNSGVAREGSLKLVNSVLIGYGYGLMASVCAPLLAVLLQQKLSQDFRLKKIWLILTSIFGLISLLLIVSLTGARGFSGVIVLTIVYAWLLRRELPLNFLYIVVGLVMVLTLPTLLTILREGNSINLNSFFFYLRSGLFTRTFEGPMRMGLWYTHFAQTVDFLGIRAIPRLAALQGMTPINAPNLIGLTYSRSAGLTIHANTCYVFAYYNYFGLLSLPLSLFGLWLLDCGLLVYNKLDDTLLVPCVASVSIACANFVSSEYTASLLTHGFIFLLIIPYFLSLWSKKRKRTGVRPISVFSSHKEPRFNDLYKAPKIKI